MGTQQCPVASDRTDLATEATLGWSRSSVAGHASGAQRNPVGLGYGGAVARATYQPYQTCRRRFQQWVREGRLEPILRALAEELQARGKLQLEEAFIDASCTGAKKGG